MTGLPRLSDSFSARARARMSELPPGGNGTIRVIGLVGKPWALVITAAKPSAMAVTMARRRNRWIFMACLLISFRSFKLDGCCFFKLPKLRYVHRWGAVPPTAGENESDAFRVRAGCYLISSAVICGTAHQVLTHSIRDLCGSGLAAQITGVQRRVGRDTFDGAHDLCCSFVFTQMFEQHPYRPERAHRIGQALAHDVEGRAVDGLEHRRVTLFRVDVAGRGNAQAAGQGRSQIAQDVGMQIGG